MISDVLRLIASSLDPGLGSGVPISISVSDMFRKVKFNNKEPPFVDPPPCNIMPQINEILIEQQEGPERLLIWHLSSDAALQPVIAPY